MKNAELTCGMFLDMPDQQYRAIPALSNGSLQLFAKDPSLYAWSMTAPSDPNKATTADFGKVLHIMLVEPHRFDDSVLVSSVKGRTTKTFVDEQINNPDKIVITEDELTQIKVMHLSAMCNPMFERIMKSDGNGEVSFVVYDKERDVHLKCRVDWLIGSGRDVLPCDIKSTADIEEWRSNREWINPLFKHGYGHTSAFYLHVLSLSYGFEINEYAFPIIQKSASLGRYPASVFRITREELEYMGFWADVQKNITMFAERYHANNFVSFESFPQFR